MILKAPESVEKLEVNKNFAGLWYSAIAVAPLKFSFIRDKYVLGGAPLFRSTGLCKPPENVENKYLRLFFSWSEHKLTLCLLGPYTRCLCLLSDQMVDKLLHKDTDVWHAAHRYNEQNTSEVKLHFKNVSVGFSIQRVLRCVIHLWFFVPCFWKFISEKCNQCLPEDRLINFF